jgi:transposase
LRSYQIGALPLLNVFLERMQLEQLLVKHLPPDDPRTELPTAKALLVLVRNVLLSREPIYGVGDWALRCAADLFDLWDQDVALICDDRVGRALHKLFVGTQPEMLLEFVRHVTATFQIGLDELHNDSTTISFYGAYSTATDEQRHAGRIWPAITYGHSKARRADLKQLLYTLTISSDGGVPVYFTTSSGNTVDDKTHIATWDMLRQIVGRADFLYVADCKLASLENLTHILARGGRFITLLPRGRDGNTQFRERLRRADPGIRWVVLFEEKNDDGDVVERCSTYDGEETADGFRLIWYHSLNKAARDAATRQRKLAQAAQALTELQARLSGPRTRFRQRGQVESAVEVLLADLHVESLLNVTIKVVEEETYRQAKPGRPTSKTPYVRTTRDRYELAWHLNLEESALLEREDGVFPLLTNDRELTAEDVLCAYRRQSSIEKRFSQFKTDFTVAPVYLKDVTKIAGLLTVYFFALVTQSLLERELRRAMKGAGLAALPIYPEDRDCARPTTHRLIELFEPVQRHVLEVDEGEPHVLVTELTPAQREIVKLFGLDPERYGL